MISKLGVSIASAIDIGCKPIADLIKYCLDSWHKISTGNRVLKVAHEGVKNLPTSDDGAAVLDHEVNQMLQKGAIKVVQSNDNENVWFLQDQ